MAAQGGNILDEVPQNKPTIQSRFSTLRFRKVVKKFNPIQIGHITNHDLSHMLNIPDHLMIKMNILQWLVDHFFYHESTRSYFIQHKEKKIGITKDIVDKIFGFQNGTVPYQLESNDPEVVKEVEFLRRQYLVDGNGMIPVAKIESIMLGANEERVFLRSFVMFYIATIICPATYNFLNPKFLFSLTDSNILLVEFYDFGTLCLEYLYEEIDNWRINLFEKSDDYNQVKWIGGCLPVLGVAYLDFVDFGGNAGNIDYGLPRITHIRNSDFKLLDTLDRNKKSRKAYGILPIRDISLTPYGLPQFPVHVVPQLPAHVVPQLPVHMVLQLPEHAEDVGDDGFNNVMSSPETIEASSSSEMNGSNSQSDFPSENDEAVLDYGLDNAAVLMQPMEGYTSLVPNALDYDEGYAWSPPNEVQHETEFGMSSQIDGTPVDTPLDSNQVVVDSPTNRTEVHTNEDSIFIGDGLLSIAASYADVQPMQEESIAEGFVPECTPPQTNVVPTQETVSQPSFDQPSLEKKNRKKRAAKTSSPDGQMSELLISTAVGSFYSKLTREKFSRVSESPFFIDIGRCPVKYDTFFSSFKPRGNVADDAMCAHAQVFNEESKQSASKKPFIKKHMFGSFISAMLMKNPSSFDKTFVVSELSRISSQVDIASLDLLHFPSVLSNHWISVCLNPLFGTMHFFDPSCLTNEVTKEDLLHNLATNFCTVCKELGLKCKDIGKFKVSTPKYPAHSLLHDCGLYVMLYAENFNGKVMKQFSKDIIPNYRMLKAYNMFNSKLNKIKADAFEKIKKRKIVE